MRIDYQILVMMTRLFDSEITFDTHSFVSARYKTLTQNMKTNYSIRYLVTILLFFSLLNVNAQSEIDFTNKVVFTKNGNISVSRFISLLPAPVTNEYQEISELQANCGRFVDINQASKVLFYEGLFNGKTMEIFESFKCKPKKIKIDFTDKSQKNEVTGIDPHKYLGSDGTYIDVNNSTIQKIGDELWSSSDDVLDYARRCYEYVASHYKYINGSWRTLKNIIHDGGGECGDFTTLFVNLMRYKGIPARHNIGIAINGGYHVWPDFYDEDYGWIPLDPTYKNANPGGDFFGRYDGELIIVSQGLTSFTESNFEMTNIPLQTFAYWYWYTNGIGDITGEHKTSKDYQINAITSVEYDQTNPVAIYNIMGIEQKELQPGINIVNGKKIYVK